MFMNKKTIILFLCLAGCLPSAAQLLNDAHVVYNADSVRAVLDKRPYFTLFRDNYFIGGTTIGHKPNSRNSDVKFQISIAQRLTKSQLPFDTYLFLQYTQKAFWNVFQKSFPMRDLNYNPGIGLGHLIVRRNKYIGKGYIMFEHESNGRDSIQSRSWNRITFAGALVFNKNWEAQLTTWIPFVASSNKDLLKYYGILQTAVTYRANNDRLICTLILMKRKSKFSFNTTAEISYKFNNNENQYFFLQYYNGFGENLLDYKRFKSMLRIGIVIKPKGFSIY